MQTQDTVAAGPAPQADAGVTNTATATEIVGTTGAGSATAAAIVGADTGAVEVDTSTSPTVATVAPHLSLLAQLEADVSAAFDKADAAETAAIAGIKASVDQFIAKTRALLSL